MKIDYSWVNGTSFTCHCGRIGIWAWERTQFEVWHNIKDKCQFKEITRQQERALRLEKGRKRPY